MLLNTLDLAGEFINLLKMKPSGGYICRCDGDLLRGAGISGLPNSKDGGGRG